MTEKVFYWNGIDAETGDYIQKPLTWSELVESILHGLRHARGGLADTPTGAAPAKRGEPPPDVDLEDLSSAGWGIVYPHDDDGRARAGLAELLEERRYQAEERFREFSGEDGYHPGDDRNSWLSRQGLGPGLGDPEVVPYYLLLAGSPAEIPFDFQFDLSARYAVARLDLETREEYARYARNVLEAEARPRRPRGMTFFGVANADDNATQGSCAHLIEPLYAHLSTRHRPGWSIGAALRQDATRGHLLRLLSGDETPAVLFTASHGMSPGKEGSLLDRVGAILCQDYPGPKKWYGQGRIPPGFYVSAADIDEDADLRGLVAFFFGCYTVGIPEHDSFCELTPHRIAPRPMISPLPQRLLGKKNGALAVIGHVDRAWDFSYTWENAGSQPQTFRAVLNRLMAGEPVAAAARFLGDRYADAGLDLKALLLDWIAGREIDENRLVEAWVAEADAKSYVVFGDPAARLVV